LRNLVFPKLSVKKLLFIFLTCLLFSGVLAQPQADSLEQLLQKQMPDTSRFWLMTRLISIYQDAKPIKAGELSKASIQLAEKIKNKVYLERAYQNHANSCESLGNYDESVVFNLKALAIAKERNDSASVTTVYNNLGITYNQMGDYALAIYHLLKAIQIDELRKDTLALGYDYINLGESYYYSKNYESALTYCSKAYLYLKKSKDYPGLQYASESLSLVLIELGQLDSANALLKQTAPLAEKTGNTYIINRCLSHVGRIFLIRNELDSAEINFTKVIAQSKAQNYADVYLPTLMHMARLQVKKQNIASALFYANEAYTGSLKIKNKMLAQTASHLLGELYTSQKKTEEAIRYLEIAHSYQDSILEQSVRGSIQAYVYDIKLENEKNENLLTQKKLDEQKVKVANQQFALILISVVLFSLFVLILIIRRAALQRKRNNEILESKNLELNKLNQEVNGLINTIVHDLKSPLNNMQGLLYLLEGEVAGNEPAQTLIVQGNKVVNQGQEIVNQLLELRELEQGSKTLEIQKIKLSDLLNNLQQEFAPSAAKKIIEIKITITEAEVSIDVAMVNRILRNLLSNAIKFSEKGKSLSIKATVENEVACFEVSDNGLGFTKEEMPLVFGKFQKLSARPTAGESSNGLGLATVALVAQKLNATVGLTSEKGKGSTFTVRVPL
jgi:signal transduction histidine kinase